MAKEGKISAHANKVEPTNGYYYIDTGTVEKVEVWEQIDGTGSPNVPTLYPTATSSPSLSTLVPSANVVTSQSPFLSAPSSWPSAIPSNSLIAPTFVPSPGIASGSPYPVQVPTIFSTETPSAVPVSAVASSFAQTVIQQVRI